MKYLSASAPEYLGRRPLNILTSHWRFEQNLCIITKKCYKCSTYSQCAYHRVAHSRCQSQRMHRAAATSPTTTSIAPPHPHHTPPSSPHSQPPYTRKTRPPMLPFSRFSLLTEPNRSIREEGEAPAGPRAEEVATAIRARWWGE